MENLYLLGVNLVIPRYFDAHHVYREREGWTLPLKREFVDLTTNSSLFLISSDWIFLIHLNYP